jgi:hypothetical protein
MTDIAKKEDEPHAKKLESFGKDLQNIKLDVRLMLEKMKHWENHGGDETNCSFVILSKQERLCHLLEYSLFISAEQYRKCFHSKLPCTILGYCHEHCIAELWHVCKCSDSTGPAKDQSCAQSLYVVYHRHFL